jgi:anti-sigma factor RsiW
MNDAIKTQISAFVDGELPQNEAELLLRRLCQDVELRNQAAEYLAMGRAMRGERAIAGMSMLRERVAAAVDDKELQEEFAEAEAAAPRFMRPLAGVAIAATVALAALIGLQQMSDVAEVDTVQGSEAVAAAADDSYTVPEPEPEPEFDLLSDYYNSHDASSSHIGFDSITPRLITYEIRDGRLVEIELTDPPAGSDEQDVENTETPSADSL